MVSASFDGMLIYFGTNLTCMTHGFPHTFQFSLAEESLMYAFLLSTEHEKLSLFRMKNLYSADVADTFWF